MAEETRDELLELLKQCNPRTRKTVMRVIEGKVSRDKAAFIQEQLSFMEPDMTVRSVDVIATKTCDAGHLLDQHVRLIAVCEVCGLHTCSTPGCSFTCARCGRALCRRHASVYGDNEAYCSTCQPVALLRWLVLGKRR